MLEKTINFLRKNATIISEDENENEQEQEDKVMSSDTEGEEKNRENIPSPEKE
jgi:hypothetical protein